MTEIDVINNQNHNDNAINSALEEQLRKTKEIEDKELKKSAKSWKESALRPKREHPR